MGDKISGLYSFLDFLAYYLPGALFILFIVVLSVLLGIEVEGIISSLFSSASLSKFTLGLVWTVVVILLPYLLGQLIFPVGYYLAWFFRARVEQDHRCNHLNRLAYCSEESLDYGQCIHKCFEHTTPEFFYLTVKRFRALSRFARSMLFPSLLTSLTFFMIIFNQSKNDIGYAILSFILAIVFLLGFMGFGIRYRRYEERWRNSVCTGGKLRNDRAVKIAWK